MDLKIYYDKIIDEIKTSKFKIIEITEPAPEKISPHLEAVNYIIYDWNRDNHDNRDLEFEYVIQPETDIDFSDKEKITFDDFFNFITKIKTDENVLIDTKGIEVIKLEKEVEYINFNDILEPEVEEPEVEEPEVEEPEVEEPEDDINKDVDMDFWDSDEQFVVKKKRR